MRKLSPYATAAFGILALLPGSALCQQAGSAGPQGQAEDPEYRIKPIEAGPFTLEGGGEVRIEYDNNVFAEPFDKQSDAIFRLRPYLEIKHRSGAFATALSARADIRRHAEFSSEDSEGANVLLTASFSPQPGEAFTLNGHWDRVAEDRGDPEARRVLGFGPRIFEIYGGSAGYRRRGSKFLIDALISGRNINALSPTDDQRDHDNYSGRVTLGYRPGGPFYFTGTGYYTQFDFRQNDLVTGADRDVSTVGALVGIEFADGGLVQGKVGAGIFKLNADDPTREDRTGFSMQGQLTYRPRERTTVRLDLFSGDVASFRGGGSSRIDTRVGIAVDQEIRHNLFASIGAEWERTNFFSIDESQQTWRASASAEYRINRHFSAFATAGYNQRTSDFALDEFDRLRGSVGIRMRF